MSHLVSLTIEPCVVSMSPTFELQNRPGLIVHDSFSERVLPSLRPVESTAKCQYEALPLRSWLGELRPYPRLPQNPLPRYRPTSVEIYKDLYPREQGMLVHWEHLAILLSLQLAGQSGLLATTDSLATLCFMRGVAEEIFLIRVFWDPSKKTWFLRAWSFQERVDRGWSRNNLLLLPFNF